MREVYIVAAQRTPIGKLGGVLAPLTAAELGGVAISAALKKSGLAETSAVDQVLMGNVIQAGNGQNPARQAAVAAGLDFGVPAITINDVCASGLSSINLAASLIGSGQANVIVAGGMESMSNAPYLLQKARFGYKFGEGKLIDAMQHDGLTDAWGGYSMGVTAENVNERYHVTREQQDAFALSSHQKATQAQENHAFDDEIVPVHVKQRKSEYDVTQDQAVRPDTSMEALGKLRPSYSEDGSVTAGNASGLNDGASAVVLASAEAVEEYGLTPLAKWEDASLVGLDPEVMGIGPYHAINKLLENTGKTIADIDLFEINEAFASQSIVCQDLLKIPDDKLNPNGGALALGHPLGSSGARILVSLVHELRAQNKHTGIASLCVGGGMGAATLITR
ncbi:MAG: acetyl-CoA C-acetyltransferase [Limosilactobacillus sp.]|uniref:thiolase family protein n=1 Tax=Limosilactobacillus sp. TaxID=2773925 RepID=UPI002709716F|nr:acetyl-CoA C-acetyltransferase [Limosilactobacillus sp.]